MDVESAIRERRSIRAFRSDPVADDAIADVLGLARWSPSWANAQDWDVWVVTGEPLAELGSRLHKAAHIGKSSHPDVPLPPHEWPEDYRRRMDIPVRRRFGNESEDGDTPTRIGRDIFHFYGAPCCLLFALDHRLAEAYASFDAGLLVQSVCLVAEAKGLGTCILAVPMRHPEVLHRLLPGTRGKRFLVAVALGYPDDEAEENRGERSRVRLDEYVRRVR